MLHVERKDDESLESLIRRFNKKVTQAGILSSARRKKYFEKPLTKREEREIAIRKRVRKEQKTREMLSIRG
ncbi:30S ribosomal protein S21 [bacterium]|nr:30S ribosomal protein S21 [bacterium]